MQSQVEGPEWSQQSLALGEGPLKAAFLEIKEEVLTQKWTIQDYYYFPLRV